MYAKTEDRIYGLKRYLSCWLCAIAFWLGTVPNQSKFKYVRTN